MATLGGVDFPDSPTVLDGGLASELRAWGHDMSDHLWSARLLLDEPAALTAAHTAFFEAGATIVTTATYQASFEGFAARGLARDDAERVLRLGVEVAVAARAGFTDGVDRWVAASVGPYGAALADGSEYRGRYGLSVADLVDWHLPRLRVLAGARPDILACETVPDAVEAEALGVALAEVDVPAWITYTVEGDRTRAGQPLDEAFAVAAASPSVTAVGVNCSAPDDIGPAIATARSVTDKPIVVYPNSGESWTGTWSGPSRFSVDLAAQWVAAGARVVGGCCRVTRSDIAALARALSPGGSPHHRRAT
ncbi:homocysteine S-methyltransferase [Actinokineospora globicatena]|uniref:Homocysteine S-methyltransferase n=1 Tax=Actinokineospora globicatena TaxID=103729 RepID=A0A9W6V4S1_9PSEU|nr:homocysteine S-methyltransferase [Actinokineospora globicatena]GLW89525.1 homocysteine S-methyltransferase [Actinokineospora globicatena]